jgi:ATP adenylyltransferase
MADRLWAPWRMEYILGPKDGPCIFCDFASAPRDAYREKLVLAVEEHALVCLNRYPFGSSHLLVAPRRHVSEFGSLPLPEYEAMQRLLRETAERLRRATGAEGFNLGKAAGAGIAEHLHGHVVPRWNGDTNFMPVLADVRVMPEYLDASWQRLAPLFADLSVEPGRPGTT